MGIERSDGVGDVRRCIGVVVECGDGIGVVVECRHGVRNRDRDILSE